MGFTRINNDLLDRLASARLSGMEYAVMLTVIRETVGYGHSSYPISRQHLADVTGYDVRAVRRALDRLIERGLICKSWDGDHRNPCMIGLAEPVEKPVENLSEDTDGGGHTTPTGRGHTTPTGRGQETPTGRGQETPTGRGQETPTPPESSIYYIKKRYKERERARTHARDESEAVEKPDTPTAPPTAEPTRSEIVAGIVGRLRETYAAPGTDTARRDTRAEPDNAGRPELSGVYRNVRLTAAERAGLESLYTPDEVSAAVDRLSGYIRETGKTYADHAAVLRRWIREDREKAAKAQTAPARPAVSQMIRPEAFGTDDFFAAAMAAGARKKL